MLKTSGSKELHLRRCLDVKRESGGWRVCHSNVREREQCHVCAMRPGGNAMGGKKELGALGLSLCSSTYRLWDLEMARKVSETLLTKSYGFLCTL